MRDDSVIQHCWVDRLNDNAICLCVSDRHFWLAQSNALLLSPLYVCCWASPVVASSSELNLTPAYHECWTYITTPFPVSAAAFFSNTCVFVPVTKAAALQRGCN